MTLRVLVACEASGMVRDAFLRRGFEAVSCDLQPTERPGPHIQGDVRQILRWRWDLVIAHPVCRYLTNSGARWLYQGGRRFNNDGTENPIDLARWRDMEEGCDFFAACWNANAPAVAVENSIMHGHARARLRSMGVPIGATYAAQPWWFAGSDEDEDNVTKAAMLLTRGLPRLERNGILDGSTARAECHRMSPGPEREKERSRTRAAVAEAMAVQWGEWMRREPALPLLEVTR